MGSRSFALIDAVAARRPPSSRREANIGTTERAAFAAAGAVLLTWALARRSLTSVAAGLVGGGLLYRGARGRSRLYEVVGITTAAPTGPVERALTVAREPAEVYAFARDPRNLARVIPHVLAVAAAHRERIEVVLATPGNGTRTWEARIVADVPEEVLEWQGIDGPSGRLMFRRAPGQRGTEVRLAIDRSPAAEVDERLRRLKALAEAGEIPTTGGQPAGRADAVRPPQVAGAA